MPKYLTNDQLKKEWSVSEEAIKKFRNNSKDPLPHLRAGRRYLYLIEEVEAWARRQAKKERVG